MSRPCLKSGNPWVLGLYKQSVLSYWCFQPGSFAGLSKIVKISDVDNICIELFIREINGIGQHLAVAIMALRNAYSRTTPNSELCRSRFILQKISSLE